MTVVRVETTFRPRWHGFHFRNQFDVSLGEIAWNQDRCGTVAAIVFTGGLAAIAWPKGINKLCGGMCWAALDRYFAHRTDRIPSTTSPPDSGTPLFKELLGRQLDTLVAHGSLPGKCWDWMTRPDEGHLTDRHSIGHLTQTEEWPRVKDLLDKGFPASLGVIRVRSLTDVWKNHQVIAWGYSFDEATRRVELDIYDPEYPDCDNVTLGFTLGQSHSRLSAKHSKGDQFRGFFVWDYDQTMIYVPPERAWPRRRHDPVLEWFLLEGAMVGSN
jgi:hypothetical protein